MKKILLKIYYKYLAVKDKITIYYNIKVISKKPIPTVLDTDKTLEKIIEDRCSVSRYGDGEFDLIKGKSIIFQPCSRELRKRLKEIIKSSNEKHIVCIPDIFNDNTRLNERSRNYWENYLKLNRNKIYRSIDIQKKYYDSLVTRLYMDLDDKSKVIDRFKNIKKIWQDKEVVIVEGEKSRLGVGNDLFNNVKNIERILCPSKDAFSSYNEILFEVKKQKKSKLILIALGPTATVLAYDLSSCGYQAIDIGHIDIEYEWFLKGVNEKCPIKDKYIGDIDTFSTSNEFENTKYENEILIKLGGTV